VIVEWFVWSTGLERWERIIVTPDDVEGFMYLYTKTIDGQVVAICRDELGRYIGGFQP